MPLLDERQRSLTLGGLARLLGHSRIQTVTSAAYAAESTLSAGASELFTGTGPEGRVRTPGAGCPTKHQSAPAGPALLALVEPVKCQGCCKVG